MATSVRDTIKGIVENHLKKEDGLCFGQCLTAVGWVGGTLPEMYEDKGMVEVTTADVDGAGATGSCLVWVRLKFVAKDTGAI